MIGRGVYQLKIPIRHSPIGYTLSYLLPGANALIDTGVRTGGARSALENQLKEVGMGVNDIEHVILTHMHRDHVGLLNYIKKNPGVKVYAHREAERAYAFVDRGERHQRVRREVEAFGGGILFKALRRFGSTYWHDPLDREFDQALNDGDIIELGGFHLRVIWTPGHALEHICLYDEDRGILFSGDHILPSITPHISFRFGAEGDPLSDYLNSLERLRGLEVNKVLPAHEYVFDDLEDRILEITLHHMERCGEIEGALEGGEKTVFQVSARIRWDSGGWDGMPVFTKYMALREAYSHLVYLRNGKKVMERLSDGVLYFSLA